MVSFDADFTSSERSTLLSRRLTLKNRVDGTAWTAADIDILKKVILDLLELGLDYPELTAEDREYSRGLNADGIPNVPEYRHELLMDLDTDYRAAWRYEFDPRFADQLALDPFLMTAVEQGYARYSYIERDPDIVDRSLLRQGMRERREGELDPPPVLGRHAPKYTIVGMPIYTEAQNSAPFGTLS